MCAEQNHRVRQVTDRYVMDTALHTVEEVVASSYSKKYNLIQSTINPVLPPTYILYDLEETISSHCLHSSLL